MCLINQSTRHPDARSEGPLIHDAVRGEDLSQIFYIFLIQLSKVETCHTLCVDVGIQVSCVLEIAHVKSALG
jgi:hypothetical protein